MDNDRDPYETDPDRPLPLQQPRPLCQVPGLLAEDIEQIAHREPENYRRWCITTHYTLARGDSTAPILVSRTHTEHHGGEEILFALLVHRPRDGMGRVTFSEIALSPPLFAELVREVGVHRPLPQEAPVPDPWDQTPEERENARWSRLLGRSATAEGDDEMPF